jgi:glycosyltransferase involved in cell wall biosynthesis
MFTSQLSGLPFSFTAHAKDIYTSNPEQLREKIQLARFVITCTEYNRKHLLTLSDGSSTPIRRIYHGIDTGLFSSKSEMPQKAGQPHRILTVARLTAKKGLPTVLKALKLMHDRGISFKHTLIGDGDDRDKILALIKETGLTPVSRWLGTMPHHEVLEHYRKADLFVLGCEVASNGDRDGIPNVLLEGMSMGVPVVVTDVSAIPELVDNEKTGLLVPPGQPERLAGAMQRLLMDSELRSRVISAARKRVAEDFNNRKLIQDLAAVYREEGIGPGASGEGYKR